jgi:CDP-4-dehydro-6-deoxyglucose reductase
MAGKTMIVRDLYDIAENVRCVRLRTSDGSEVSFKPGQYVNLRFYVDGRRYTRSYSIATVPRGPFGGEIELCIALVEGGVGSNFIRSLRPDDTVEMQGPVGVFTLRSNEPKNLVMVATGTGIVPFRSMRRQIRDLVEKKGHNVHLVYGCRREEDFVYDAEWRSLAMQCSGFHYHPCASQADDPFKHRRDGGINGRVQVGLDQLDVPAGATAYYLCGVPQMIEDVEDRLIASGVPVQDIITELYISPEYETTSAAS